MNLLVALDVGPESEALLVSARVLSHVSGWPMRVMHVRRTADEPELTLPARLATNTTVEEAVGDPVELIIAATGDDDVLGFALRRESEEGFGLVAEALLAGAPHALFVTRPGMRAMASLRHILVPLEGSPSTSEAMRLTEDAFCARGREIAVLHVGTSDTPDEPGSLPAPRMVDQEQYEWSSWHEEFTMRFATCPSGGRHRTMVRVGEPGDMMLDEAGRLPADLLVLAWAGVYSEGRSLLVRRLLEESPCPVLLVRAPGQ